MDFLRLNIRHIRSIHGLSQPKLAELLGVKRDNVASYERGTVPPLEIIQKIVNQFNISFNDLLEKDLSHYISKQVNGPIIDTTRKNYNIPEKRVDSVNEGVEHSHSPTVQSLMQVVKAQEETIATQKETIQALKDVIRAKKAK